MARFSIISKDGTQVLHEGYPKYIGTYLNVPYLEFSSIESPNPIEWQVGDFVVYHRTGSTYKLYNLPEPKKQAKKGSHGAAFVYSNVKFYSAVKDLEIAPFRDVVSDDNKIHFSTRPEVNTTENVYGIASRIQESLNDIFPNKWEIVVFDTDDNDLLALFNEARDFSVSNASCLDALSQIYETWKNVGWIHETSASKERIVIGATSLRNENNTSEVFAYGKGKGLTAIKKAVANEGEFATRLYIYGSERNIQTRYYNGLDIHNNESVDIRNLMIPPTSWGKTDGKPDARKAYLQASDEVIAKYGLIPRTVYFDGSENEEIYPSITGLTFREVRKAILDSGTEVGADLPADIDARIDLVWDVAADAFGDGSQEDIEANPTFLFGLQSVIGFNVQDQAKLTAEGYATVSMKTGACAGREFKVKTGRYSITGGTKLYFELEKIWDESIGEAFPNTRYPIGKGDQFVLLDIPMPDYYITLAQDRLLKAGEKMLADYTRVSAFYEPSIDSIKIAQGGKLFREGMYMQVYDEDIVDTSDKKDYVLIDTLTIDEKGELPKYQVTLREQKRSVRTFGSLEDMIEDTKRETSEKINNQRQYTDRRFRSAQETIEMLKGAFSNFSEGISPIFVQTMSLLLGDESLQFIFTGSRNSLESIPCPISYRNDLKKFSAVPASLIHMTLGIEAVTSSRSRVASEFLSWDLGSWESATFEEEEKRYYVYAKVSKTGTTGTYVFSETSIGMESVSGYYHLLIGILNAEYDGKRDFVTLYGFTEVLPGQITTDIIRDGAGNLIIDLLNATITAKNGAKIIGDVQFGAGSTGLDSLAEWQSLQSEVGGVKSSVQSVQDQIDGVVENWNGLGTPTLSNKPAVDWKTDNDKIAHINDTYINIEEYVDDDTTPTAGQAWRWCDCGQMQEDSVEVTDNNGNKLYLHWHPIADSDAVRALKDAAEATRIASEASRVNLLSNSSELVIPAITGNYNFKPLAVPVRIKKDDTFTFAVETAQAIEGSFSEFSIQLYSLDVQTAYSAATTISLGNKVSNTIVVNSNSAQSIEAVLLIYAGKKGETAGKSLRLSNFSLVKGSTPMNVWEDCTLDSSFNNLLSVAQNQKAYDTSLVEGHNNQYTYFTSKLPSGVKKGERYTFFCLYSRQTAGTDTIYKLVIDDGGSTALCNYTELPFGVNNCWRTMVIHTDSDIARLVVTKTNQPNTTSRGEFKNISLVKGSSPLVNWRPNTDYLFNAFKNGTTKISGGLVMTQAVMVEDGSGNVKGMLNGSDYGKDTTHGKLILAAGSSGATEANMKEANTRIYDDGHIVSNSMELKEGCTVGGAVRVIENGIEIDNTNVDGKLSITELGLILESSNGHASIGNCAGAAVQGLGKGSIINCPEPKYNVGVHGGSEATGAAFMSDQGMFYGLRPRTRSVGPDETLSIYDYNVVAGRGTITLPSDAQLQAGQTYRIFHNYVGALTINGGSKNIIKMNSSATSSTTLSSSKRQVIELLYTGSSWSAINYQWTD